MLVAVVLFLNRGYDKSYSGVEICGVSIGSFTIFDSVPFVPVDYLSGNRNFFIRHVVAGKSFMAIWGCNMAVFAVFAEEYSGFPVGGGDGFSAEWLEGFFLWGGISVLHQRETVQYSWDGAPLYIKV